MNERFVWELKDWISETRKLIQQEWNNELEFSEQELNNLSKSSLQANKKTVFSVIYSSSAISLYGRQKLTFQAKSSKESFSIFSSGDIVRFVPNESNDKILKQLVDTNQTTPTGVVTRVFENEIKVVFDSEIDNYLRKVLDLKKGIRIDKMPNTRTHEIHLKTLKTLEKQEMNYNINLIPLIYGQPSFISPSLSKIKLDFFNKSLNESQRQAVSRAFETKLSLIHGPPGTGKTTTVVEVLLQAVYQYKYKVLVCAPSNIAVDNVLVKLNKQLNKNTPVKKQKRNKNKKWHRDISMIRLGHPARLLPEVLNSSLESVLYRSDGMEIIKDIKDEVQGLVKTLYPAKPRESKSAKKERIDYGKLKRDLRESRKELKQREKKLATETLKHVDVVFATNVGSEQLLKFFKDTESKKPFDLLIIDEAAQGFELDCLVPLKFCSSLVLVGDHKQLSPTIKDKALGSSLLSMTLFARQKHNYSQLSTMLNVQYRMHELINAWSSEQFYDSALLADISVKSRDLKTLYNSGKLDDEDITSLQPLYLIDTAFCGYDESYEGDLTKGSKLNDEEAELVVEHVKLLISRGVPVIDIAVVTPYSAQVKLIKHLFSQQDQTFPGLEVRTIDGFQGQEKAAIILSLVRSNDTGSIGFLNDSRRMNVAVTRAKAHVCLICDTETIASCEAKDILWLNSLIKHFRDNGVVKILHEELNLMPVQTRKTNMTKGTQKKANDRVEFSAESLKVTKFLQSEVSNWLEISPLLNSYERHMLHEVCEDYNKDVSEQQKVLHLTVDASENSRKLFLFKGRHALKTYLSIHAANKDLVDKLKKESNKRETANSPLVIEEQNAKEDITDNISDNEEVKANQVVTTTLKNEAEVNKDLESPKQNAFSVFDHESETDNISSPESMDENEDFLDLSEFIKPAENNIKAGDSKFDEIFKLRAEKYKKHQQEINETVKVKKIDELVKSKKVEDDDMKLLDNLVKANQTCGLNECTEKVTRFSLFICRYCKLSYCAQHRYSYSHGCAEEDRKQKGLDKVRKNIKSSTRVSKDLQKKSLKKKLDKLKKKRTRKTKKKK